MFAYLRGRVAEKRPTEIVLDVGGVAFRLRVPLTASARFPAGGEAQVFTSLVVRQDEISLYGFHGPEARWLFERLLRISGIGPQTALSILSGGEVPEILKAVRSGDAAWLTEIRGVGKKTAQRVILELAAEAAEGPPSEEPEASRDAAQALISLGYGRQEAERRVAAAREKAGKSVGIEALIREAVRGRMKPA